MRKPVAAIPTETEEGPSVVVICDDGAVFELQEDDDGEGQHWEEYPSVPGTRAREGDSDRVKDEFLQMATRFFREALDTPPPPDPRTVRDLLDGRDLEAKGEAARHREPEGGAAVRNLAREVADAPTFLCAAPHCPGHPWKASDRPHPADTCRTPGRELDRPTFFCAFHGCPGYAFKASDRSHPEDVCGRPERHLDRPEPATGDEPYRGADL